MAGKTISMEVLEQIRLLREQGISIKGITKVTGCSRNTIRSYLSQIESGRQSDQKKPPGNEIRHELERLIPGYVEELKRTGVTRQLLWQEYLVNHPQGYSYTQFCFHMQQYKERDKATLRIEQKPGDKFYIDYAGKRPELVDRETGEISKADMFIGVLGFSGLTYAEVTLNQQKEEFIRSVENGFEYLGGVPQVLVPDNLKSGVQKASRYEAELNRDFLDMANHYGVAVLPTRSAKPRDKAWVERMVAILYTRIYARLRNEVFHSIEAYNEALRPLLEEHNNMLLQGRGISRRELFEQQERSFLKPLPIERYELKEYLHVKVMKNCHVCLHADKHYYSVPYAYIGKKVEIIYTSRHVAIHYSGQRIALHLRNRRPYGYTTVKEHLPSNHQFVSDWNPEKFLEWGRRISPDVENYIQNILDRKVYPEVAYRSCVGILSMEKKYGRERLINACKRASSFGLYHYKAICQIIDKKLDNLSPEDPSTELSLPFHENVRGADYYK